MTAVRTRRTRRRRRTRRTTRSRRTRRRSCVRRRHFLPESAPTFVSVRSAFKGAVSEVIGGGVVT